MAKKDPGQFHNPERFIWDEDEDIIPLTPVEPKPVEPRTPPPAEPSAPRTPAPRRGGA